LRYRLGNRSALDWIIDQYQVSTDKRSGIVSDPNRANDEEYIVRLVGRVITVSLETMVIVDGVRRILLEGSGADPCVRQPVRNSAGRHVSRPIRVDAAQAAAKVYVTPVAM